MGFAAGPWPGSLTTGFPVGGSDAASAAVHGRGPTARHPSGRPVSAQVPEPTGTGVVASLTRFSGSVVTKDSLAAVATVTTGSKTTTVEPGGGAVLTIVADGTPVAAIVGTIGVGPVCPILATTAPITS